MYKRLFFVFLILCITSEIDAQRSRRSSKRVDDSKKVENINKESDEIHKQFGFKSKEALVEALLQKDLSRSERSIVEKYGKGKRLSSSQSKKLISLLEEHSSSSSETRVSRSGRKSSRQGEPSARSSRSGRSSERKTRASRSGRSSARTTDTENDSVPSFLAEIENGTILELVDSSVVSSGRRASGRISGRLAGQGQAEETTALENFSDPISNKYIWDRIRKWMRGTPEQIAQACLERQWCDAFYTYEVYWRGNTYYRGALCDDVDPLYNWYPSSRYGNINAYVYKDVEAEEEKNRILANLQTLNNDKRNQLTQLKNERDELIQISNNISSIISTANSMQKPSNEFLGTPPGSQMSLEDALEGVATFLTEDASEMFNNAINSFSFGDNDELSEDDHSTTDDDEFSEDNYSMTDDGCNVYNSSAFSSGELWAQLEDLIDFESILGWADNCFQDGEDCLSELVSSISLSSLSSGLSDPFSSGSSSLSGASSFISGSSSSFSSSLSGASSFISGSLSSSSSFSSFSSGFSFRRSGRASMADVDDDADPIDYFVSLGANRYISSQRKWYVDENDNCARWCLEENECDAFYTFTAPNGKNICTLCDDVDPIYECGNSRCRSMGLQVYAFNNNAELDMEITELQISNDALDQEINSLEPIDQLRENVISSIGVLATVMKNKPYAKTAVAVAMLDKFPVDNDLYRQAQILKFRGSINDFNVEICRGLNSIAYLEEKLLYVENAGNDLYQLSDIISKVKLAIQALQNIPKVGTPLKVLQPPINLIESGVSASSNALCEVNTILDRPQEFLGKANDLFTATMDNLEIVSEASGYIHGFLSLAQSCAVELREIESADGLHETRADYINALITAAGLFDTMSSGLKELNNSIDELTKGIMAELEIFDGLGIGDIVDDLRIISQILDYKFYVCPWEPEDPYIQDFENGYGCASGSCNITVACYVGEGYVSISDVLEAIPDIEQQIIELGEDLCEYDIVGATNCDQVIYYAKEAVRELDEAIEDAVEELLRETGIEQVLYSLVDQLTFGFPIDVNIEAWDLKLDEFQVNFNSMFNGLNTDMGNLLSLNLQEELRVCPNTEEEVAYMLLDFSEKHDSLMVHAAQEHITGLFLRTEIGQKAQGVIDRATEVQNAILNPQEAVLAANPGCDD